MSLQPMSDSWIEAIGKTPLVKLNNITEGLNATIAVKLEYSNPTCSMKDRTALSMIAAAEAEGKITPGKSVIVEGTSGSMGISLAAICNQKGYKCVLVMPSSVSTERRAAVKSLGATLVLCDPAGGFEGVAEAVDRVSIAIPNSYKTEQFVNADNPQAHYRTTGVEIYEQTNGKVYGMEPYESSVLNGFPMGTHKIQGIGAGFFPTALDRLLLNEVLRVKSDDAIEMTRRLAKEEGLMLGFSSGANVCAAIQYISPTCRTTELYGDVMTEAAQMTMMSPEEQVQLVKKELNC